VLLGSSGSSPEREQLRSASGIPRLSSWQQGKADAEHLVRDLGRVGAGDRRVRVDRRYGSAEPTPQRQHTGEEGLGEDPKRRVERLSTGLATDPDVT